MDTLILSRYGIQPDIIISESNFFTLSIENKEFLMTVLSQLRNQIDGGKEDGFNLSFNGKALSIQKSVSGIFDFTNLDFNSKSITNLLIKKFSEFLELGEQTESLITLESIFYNLAEDFKLKSGLNIEYDTNVNGACLSKVCSFKISDGKSRLLERLCEYVNLLCELIPIRLFILVFGKEFLSENNIMDFHNYCCDKSVRLMFVEGTDKSRLLPIERRLVIDKDICTIPQGYDEFAT